jgi:hypothetical protein
LDIGSTPGSASTAAPASVHCATLQRECAHFANFRQADGHKPFVSTHTSPRRRPAPSADEAWGAVRRLALLAAVALLVAELTSAFAGILVSVVGLAALAAYAAATTERP